MFCVYDTRYIEIVVNSELVGKDINHMASIGAIPPKSVKVQIEYMYKVLSVARKTKMLSFILFCCSGYVRVLSLLSSFVYDTCYWFVFHQF